MNRWLDRELVETVAGVITATSTDGSSSSMPFSLNVFDVDEFRTGQVSDIDDAPNTVLETASIGTPVGITGFAEDKDVSATISYSLREDADGRFAIDPQTGVVYVAADLDLEAPGAVNSHGVYVEAVSSDGTGAIRYYSIDVTDVDEFSLGELIDINDLPNQVDATAPSGTEIGITVFAADDDFTGSAGYRIEEVTGINNDGNASPFQLNGDGVIIVWHSHRFDIDVSPQVFIKVVAESGRSPDAISTREQTFVVDLIGVKADPPEEKWYDNPQGDRVESSYTAVTASDFENCRALDEDINSPSTYNNEWAYFDCLDRYLPSEIADSAELICARQFDLEPEESERFGKVTITNAHTSTIEIREILPSGRVRYAATLEPSQTSDILTKYDGRNVDPKRGVVFVGIDDSGTCVGAGKPREPQNRFTFGTPGTFQENPESQASQNGGSANVTPPVFWTENPQGSRRETDYPAMSADIKAACFAVDNDANSPETYNNETAYFDCIEASMDAEPKWYSNPQGDLSDTDFEAVSQADRDNCQAIDGDKYSISFNNERDYFGCLAAAMPAAPVQGSAGTAEAKWYENPQGNLRDEDFPTVSDADRQICIANDENVDLPDSYNNEDAYFKCLASYETPSDGATLDESASGSFVLADDLVSNGCIDERSPSEYISDKPTQVTIENIGSSPLHIFWVSYEGDNANYDGDFAPQAVIAAGENWQGEAFRGFNFSVLREDGSCAGFAKARESQNSFQF
jgi:hypothetical protein